MRRSGDGSWGERQGSRVGLGALEGGLLPRPLPNCAYRVPSDVFFEERPALSAEDTTVDGRDAVGRESAVVSLPALCQGDGAVAGRLQAVVDLADTERHRGTQAHQARFQVDEQL